MAPLKPAVEISVEPSEEPSREEARVVTPGMQFGCLPKEPPRRLEGDQIVSPSVYMIKHI